LSGVLSTCARIGLSASSGCWHRWRQWAADAVIVIAADQPERYLLIDGYRRVRALEQLGRDTVEAVVWSLSEAEALFLDRSMRAGEQATALEEGWLLAEMSERFGYDQEELARRFDRSVSWVSRRMGLVELLPAAVQQQVRSGAITAHVAMKFLVPVARSGAEDCCRMAEGFARHRLRSREAGQLYVAWRGATARCANGCWPIRSCS